MMPVIFELKDALRYPWLLQKLEQDKGGYWSNGKVFRHEGLEYKFKYPILARKRKDSSRGYAYEEISPTVLGSGVCGSVQPIHQTLSKDKSGKFTIKDHNRAVKIMSDEKHIKREYEGARLSEHLRAKEPHKGHMVMGRIKGQTLHHFLQNAGPLSIHEKLKLTTALLRALKKQVTSKGLIHQDLHSKNVMINLEDNEYKINIIDFGRVLVPSSGPATGAHDLSRIIYCLDFMKFWSFPELAYPKELQEIIDIFTRRLKQPPLDELIKKLECIVFTVEDEARLKKVAYIETINKHIMALKPLSELFIEKDSKEKKELDLLINRLEAGTKSGTDSDLEDCAKACDAYLQAHSKNLKSYMRKKDILYEIALILTSLIVLYPFVMGMNYMATRKWTFFGENELKTELEKTRSHLKNKY